jgi:hypothetical protein
MNVVYQGTGIRVPDFLIVGAARSGTTSLYSFLDGHPGIFLPREKEPMFFSVYGQGWSYIDIRTGGKATYVVEDLADYLMLFRRARTDQLIGEASTWYLYHYQNAIGNIHKIYGEKARLLKIIILLRNPAERAWSHYMMNRRNGIEVMPFEQAIRPEVVRDRLERHFVPGFDYIGFGRYFHQVEAYVSNFPRVKVLLFEEMVEDMVRSSRGICDFLGVEAIPSDGEEKPLNVSGSPKNKAARALANIVYRPNRLKSWIRPLVPYKARAALRYRLSEKIFRPIRIEHDLKDKLAENYRDDILALARLIDRDFSGWLPPVPEKC